ncbi:YceD family protein [Rhodoferax sp.]|uniref:YceD family protein n=1 Tax=Rhodoferax sp. TaxID=50421 RepID=UPI002749E9B8|nr:YceD family protein [Rhodoferax sp.]
MNQACAPNNVDIRALALSNAQMTGSEPLAGYARLMAETLPDGGQALMRWEARCDTRADASGALQPWMHLTVTVSLSLICQRCLGAVAVPVAVDRLFRFVSSEDVAELEDEEADEDVLALDKQFRLRDLIEDEVLMAMPLVPRHETCPGNVQLSAADPGFEEALAAKPKPFDALAAFKTAPKR